MAAFYEALLVNLLNLMISAINYLLCPEKQKIITLNGNLDFSVACVS